MISAVRRQARVFYQFPGLARVKTRVTEPLLVYHCGYSLATGEAKLHDVGELPVGVLHGYVIGHHQALQCLRETLKFYETA